MTDIKQRSKHSASRSNRSANDRKKRRALQLKELAAALRLALSASQTGVWSYTAATGEITTDDQLAIIFGAEVGKFGRQLDDLLNRVYIDDRASAMESIERALRETSDYEFEKRIIWPDNSIHYVLFKGSVCSDDTGNPSRLTGVCVNISKRREAEERLALALKASRTGTWVAEIESGNLIWDDQTHALYGVRVGEFGLKIDDFLKLLGPSDVEKTLRALGEAIEIGTEFQVEHRIVWQDGSVHFIESRGQAYHDHPLRTAGVSFDITERKLLEQEHLQLASVVESSVDGIIGKTLEGIVTSWNQSAERIFGFSADEMIGKNVSKLMINGGVDELPFILEKLKLGKIIDHYESTRVRKDGSKISVSLTLSPIKDSAGTVIGASTIVRDITGRQRTDQMSFAQNEVTRLLSESDSLLAIAPKILQLLARTIPASFGALWCLDRDHQLLSCVDVWNDLDPNLDEFAALSKYITLSAGRSLPSRVLESRKATWIPDLVADGNFIRVHAAAKANLKAAMGFPILLGTRILGVLEFCSGAALEPADDLIDMMTNICAQLGQFIDRKYAEETANQAVLAQVRTGQAIMENAPIGIAWLDKNLVISQANHAFGVQFGVNIKQLPGMFIFQIPTGIPEKRLVEVVQHGVPFSATDFRMTLIGAQGPRDAFCDLTIWPVKDNSDRPVGLVVLIVEVTERVKLAKQREDFVATLTHDLKNPLMGQERLLNLFLEESFGTIHAEQVTVLSLIKTSTKEMLELIGTLLEVYRYEEGAQKLLLEPLNVVKLIGDCVAQMNPISSAKGVEIRVAFPDTVAELNGDKMALRRVVTNLLDNAVKFTPPQGLIEVSCLLIDSNVTITIKDNGPGIAAEEIPSLFKRFAQAKLGRTHQAGTGLGLYLCNQIVDAHGGRIVCTSQLGVGTTLVVTLPVRRNDGIIQ